MLNLSAKRGTAGSFTGGRRAVVAVSNFGASVRCVGGDQPVPRPCDRWSWVGIWYYLPQPPAPVPTPRVRRRAGRPLPVVQTTGYPLALGVLYWYMRGEPCTRGDNRLL